MDAHFKEVRPPVTKRVALNLLLFLFAILFGLALAEIGTRVFSVVLHRPPIVMRDAYLGWSLVPNLQKIVVGSSSGGGSYHLSTDSEGRRITYPRERSIPESSPLVVFLGDSFTNGVTVDDEETFAWRLAERFPQYHFVNLGVLGYGTDQELVRLERFLESKPRAPLSDVVVLLTETDFRDTQRSYDPILGRSKPSFRVTESGLERGNYRPSVLDFLMDYSRLVWLVNSKMAAIWAPPPLPMSQGYGLVEACLEAMRTLAASKGVRLHVFAYRRPVNSEVDMAYWNQFLGRSKAVEITDSFRGDDRLIGYDGGHWSPAGNARAADVIAKFLGSDQE